MNICLFTFFIISGDRRKLLSNLCIMTERQIQRQLKVIEEATQKALQSKETALKFLEDAGILALCEQSKEEDKREKKK
jgi:hypothetical protein